MKQYRIIVTPDAEEDLEHYVSYIRNIKKNPQAVKSILEDFRETKKSLRNVVGSLRQPYSEELQKRDLKRMNFLKHNYFLLYQISADGIVYITNIFHGLENFEAKLR